MNEKRLKTIFRNYIEKFNWITYEKNQENYKWEIAYDFRRLMDDALSSEAGDMYDKMRRIVTLADNLLSNQFELPGAAICDYSKREPEKMRGLFQNLFAEDGGDLEKRQERIDSFVDECNELKAKYFPTSYKYDMGQRAVMVLLGLYDPENNYLYKPMQANEFADCAEFYDDFGPSTHFKLSVYYRMCDELVTAMREDEELMARHRSRYDNPSKPIHEDKGLHILAFDIIYSGTTYHLFDNIDYSHISSKERKEYLESVDKAEVLAGEVDAAQRNLDLYQEAVDFYSGILHVGAIVKHKMWGEGTIVQYKDSPTGGSIRVQFPAFPEGKSFEAAKSVVGGFLQLDIDGLSEKNAKYKSVVNKGGEQLRRALQNAEDALRPYEKYLR